VGSSGVQGQHVPPWVCDLNPLIKNLERQLAQVVHKQEKPLEQVQAAQNLIQRNQ
jgi:hypothetical protein